MQLKKLKKKKKRKKGKVRGKRKIIIRLKTVFLFFICTRLTLFIAFVNFYAISSFLNSFYNVDYLVPLEFYYKVVIQGPFFRLTLLFSFLSFRGYLVRKSDVDQKIFWKQIFQVSLFSGCSFPAPFRQAP